MNFEFTEDMIMLREQAERLFAAADVRASTRAVLEGHKTFDDALWRELGELGWLGVTIPEELGGVDLGPQAMCVVAEQIGRSLAAIPFASSVYLATEAILLAGSPDQKRDLLPKLASGELIGTFAYAAPGSSDSSIGSAAIVHQGRINSTRLAVADGTIADIAIVAALNEDRETALYVVDLKQDEVERRLAKTVDPTRNHGWVSFHAAPTCALGGSAVTPQHIELLLTRACVPIAFEQLGGAGACLDMARNYALERRAFGRPIGSFQAIKHKLARMFVLNEIARSNAYYGAWALSTNDTDVAAAAAVARLSAIDAYHYATRESLQVFGGMGFTWEADCHLYLRRAKLLSASLGGHLTWTERLMSHLEARFQ